RVEETPEIETVGALRAASHHDVLPAETEPDRRCGLADLFRRREVVLLDRLLRPGIAVPRLELADDLPARLRLGLVGLHRVAHRLFQTPSRAGSSNAGSPLSLTTTRRRSPCSCTGRRRRPTSSREPRTARCGPRRTARGHGGHR